MPASHDRAFCLPKPLKLQTSVKALEHICGFTNFLVEQVMHLNPVDTCNMNPSMQKVSCGKSW